LPTPALFPRLYLYLLQKKLARQYPMGLPHADSYGHTPADSLTHALADGNTSSDKFRESNSYAGKRG